MSIRLRRISSYSLTRQQFERARLSRFKHSQIQQAQAGESLPPAGPERKNLWSEVSLDTAEALFHQLPIAAHILTVPEGEIIKVNKRWAELMGYDPSEVVGQPFHDHIRSDQKKQVLARFEDKGQGNNVSIVVGRTFLTKDGRELFVISRDRLLQRDDGSRVMFTLILDVTEYNRRHSRYVENGFLEKVTAGVAHRISNNFFTIRECLEKLRNTFLQNMENGKALGENIDAIDGSLQAIEEQGADKFLEIIAAIKKVSAQIGDQKANNLLLHEIKDALNNIQHLTAEMIAFSKSGKSEMRFDLGDAIDGTIDKYHKVIRDLNIDLRVDLRECEIVGDVFLFDKAVSELIENAYEAILAKNEGGGIIKVAMHRVKFQDHASVPPGVCLNPGEYAVVRVEDTGVGIEDENIGKIFEPFYSTKNPSVKDGFGLSWVIRAVDRHGGDVRAESEKGKGTSLELFLPLAKE
ncbi:MAG: ATP-binding protein, partial [Candidatus Margulisbacteria bacterium]|nr:ATP-binding protein [Candidatus Margulisiibacteriota bacterium]